MSDQDLRQALLGTWRLISFQNEVHGAVIDVFGDNPHGYLVYMPDGHIFVQFAARERPVLFEPSAHGPALLDTAMPNARLGFIAYCGTFEVRDGQAIHHMEFGITPGMAGRTEARSVVLDGDRLILGNPRGSQLEWQRVHSAEPR